MSTLAEELTALKTEEDKITGNKVANFSYDDYAYEHNDANGVDTYNVDAHQNIPNGTASILKVNTTILTKGWRAQASAITRMLMNHFLGRCSYNLNKINDHFSTLLTKLLSYLGVANGIATLDTNGYVPTGQLSPTGVVKTVNGASPVNGNITKAQIGVDNVVNTGDSATPVSGGTTKFTTGGAYTELAKKAPNNHASSDTTYGVASGTNYGHVKLGAEISGDSDFIVIQGSSSFSINHTGTINISNMSIGTATITVKSSLSFPVQLDYFVGNAGGVSLNSTQLSSQSDSITITLSTNAQALLIVLPSKTTGSKIFTLTDTDTRN